MWLIERARNIITRFQEPVPRRLRGEVAQADPHRLFPGTMPFNPSVLITRKGMEVFDEMRRDDQVKAAMVFKKHAVLAGGWRIESPGDRPEDWEPAAFAREMLSNLEGTFEEALLSIMTNLDYGFSITEKIFTDDQGDLVIKALKTRRPHTFDFPQDEYGNVLSIQQQTTNGIQTYPREKFIHYAYQNEFGNPYGVSDLEACYRPWWFKANAYIWQGMLLERFGVPPVIAKYRNLDAQQVEILKDVLKNLQAATAAIVPFEDDPDDIDFWSPEMAGQVATVFKPAMDMYNVDIARGALMPGLLGLTPEQAVGSMARAKVIFDTFMYVRDFIASSLEERIVNEQILRPVLDLNFNLEDYPRFVLLPIDDGLQEELFKAWVELVKVGAVQSTLADEAHLRDLMDFPEREPDDEEEEPSDDEPESPEGAPEEFVMPTQGRMPQGEPVRREHTEAERRTVVFTELERMMDEVEARGVEKLVGVLRRAAQKLERPSSGLPQFTGRRSLETAFQELMTEAYAAGRRSVRRSELRRTTEAQEEEVIGLFSPQAALNYLRRKAVFISGVMSDRILQAVRNTLLAGLRAGETQDEQVQRVREVMRPWVDPAVSEPARVSTIVRTNVTEAFNVGRLAEFRNLGQRVVPQVQYSAILDSRTTEICRFLDERVFDLNDPALSRLTPPNHFNCRSILVPVTQDLIVTRAELVSRREAVRAEELAGEGFT